MDFLLGVQLHDAKRREQIGLFFGKYSENARKQRNIAIFRLRYWWGEGGFTPAGHKLRLHRPTAIKIPAIHTDVRYFWWGKVDSLFCGKATAVAARHWRAAKSRLSNPPPENPYQKKDVILRRRLFSGGGRWIRTTEVTDNRFTVCPLWPLGNSPIFSSLRCRNWSW